jgi:hypothetical protein
MSKLPNRIFNRFSILLIILLLSIPGKIFAQKIGFGVFADPVISWFSSNNVSNTWNKGARAGFNFGFTFDKYFAENYAFSTGLSLQTTGGRLVSSDTIKNFSQILLPGKAAIYKIQYLAIPVGLKFKSNQIGYVTFFTDLGLDPKFLVGGKVSLETTPPIKGEGAMNYLNIFNISYHIMGGVEYSIGGSTAVVLGLGFEKNLLDITNNSNNQHSDKISQNILKVRVGVNF